MNLQIKLVTYGADGCNIPYSEIKEISQMVVEKYNFSSPYFWMWKIFKIGFAYGKREERARRKKQNGFT